MNGLPEIQFVALKNIELILQKHPTFISNVTIFFCKYDDPIYVKVAKLGIIAQLVDESNIAKVLGELQLYATEIDVDFVKRAVRVIGRCALMIETTASDCVKVLGQLLESKISYVVQEATIVLRDIYRKYPSQPPYILDRLLDSTEYIDEEDDSKAAFIWIIGEFAHKIDDAEKLLKNYLDNIQEDEDVVQYAILTAAMKLFFKKPDEGRKLIPIVLKVITEDIDNPDLRDRGYMYWRMLANDPIAAQNIIMGEKPSISIMSTSMEPEKLGRLIYQLSTLSALTFVPPPLSEKQVSKIVTLHNRAVGMVAESKTKQKESASPPKPARERYQTADQGLYNVNQNNGIINPAMNLRATQQDSLTYTTGIGELPLDLFASEPYTGPPQSSYQNYNYSVNSSNSSPIMNELRGFDPLMMNNQQMLSDKAANQQLYSEHNPFLNTKGNPNPSNPFLSHQQLQTMIPTGATVKSIQPTMANHFDSDLIGLDLLDTNPTSDSIIDPFRQTSLQTVEPLDIFLSPNMSDGLKLAGRCKI